MTRIIAVANQKGGVGKTTTSINLAASVASRGYRVLLVDFDPQGNASSGVGYPHNKIELSIYDALLGEVSLEDTIRPTEITTLFVVPATTDLVGAEIELIGAERRERYLANALESVAASYDYVIVDCPPSLGLLTLNALVAADGVVVPMQAEYFALEGLSALTKTIEKVRQAYNPHLQIDGVVFTMFDGRLSLANQVRLEVENYFGDKVFQANIPRNVRLSEAPSHGKPCLLYDLRCVGTSSYLALADELLDRTLMVQAPAPQGSGSTPAPASGSGSPSSPPTSSGSVAKSASAAGSKPVTSKSAGVSASKPATSSRSTSASKSTAVSTSTVSGSVTAMDVDASDVAIIVSKPIIGGGSVSKPVAAILSRPVDKSGAESIDKSGERAARSTAESIDNSGIVATLMAATGSEPNPDTAAPSPISASVIASKPLATKAATTTASGQVEAMQPPAATGR